jgi:hypothetical protein
MRFQGPQAVARIVFGCGAAGERFGLTRFITAKSVFVLIGNLLLVDHPNKDCGDGR